MSEKTIKNNDNIHLLDGNHLYIYLYKKAEKLASALYMVTNFIPEKEIIRTLLRDKSINIFSDIMQLQKMSLIDGKSLNDNNFKFTSLDFILSGITEIISLLEIAVVSGYISDMNFSIIKQEYADLGILIKTRKEEIFSGNIQLPKSFFDVPNLYETHTLKHGINKQKDTKFIKDKDSSIKDNRFIKSDTKNIKQEIFKTHPQNINFIKDKNSNIKKQDKIIHPKTTDIRHNSRRNTILELLQNKPFVTVKDVVDAIHGCSSKTLQRELLSLVSEGILKKKGERRWSTYSLA